MNSANRIHYESNTLSNDGAIDVWSNERSRTIHLRNRSLTFGEKTLIMGILNVTPDSFSDGGRYETVDSAVVEAKRMVEQGADIIDVGGESTRPGAEPVDLEEELRRVIPVVRELVDQLDVPISIDTYKPEVARQALEAGAHIINDIWGLKRDPQMASVVASYGAAVIAMHNRLKREYDDFLRDVQADLLESIRIAEQAGIDKERIWIDPGFGFAKNIEDNLYLMNHLTTLVKMGHPVVLGTSRKSMIWKTLQRKPSEVIEGTAVTVTLGIAQGCHIIRVHDVEEMKRVATMTDAIIKQTHWVR